MQDVLWMACLLVDPFLLIERAYILRSFPPLLRHTQAAEQYIDRFKAKQAAEECSSRVSDCRASPPIEQRCAARAQNAVQLCHRRQAINRELRLLSQRHELHALWGAGHRRLQRDAAMTVCVPFLSIVENRTWTIGRKHVVACRHQCAVTPTLQGFQTHLPRRRCRRHWLRRQSARRPLCWSWSRPPAAWMQRS